MRILIFNIGGTKIMKRTISFLLACLLVFGLVMTGCDNGGTTSTPSDSAPASSEQESAVEPVTIELMHWWAYVTDEIIQEFEDENPGVTVVNNYVAPDQYQSRLKLLSSTNELPDAFGVMGPDAADFADQGLLEQLNYLLEEEAYDQDKTFGETVEPSLLSSAHAVFRPEQIANGEIFSMPFGAITVAVVYNKNIFNDVGIQEPKTWSEFLSNNDKIKEAGYIPLSFTGKVWGDWWYRIAVEQFFRERGTVPADFLSGDAKWTDQEAVDAFNLLKDIWNKGHFDPGGFANGIEESQALFVQQKLAQFYVVPENFVTYLVENTPDEVEIGAFTLPAMVDGIMPKGLGGAPNVLCISSASGNKELAGKLIKYIISETTFGKLAEVAVVPSLKGYTPPEGDFIMKAFADASAGGFIVDPYQANSEFTTWMNQEGYPEFLLRNLDTEDFLETVQKKFEEMVIDNQ